MHEFLHHPFKPFYDELSEVLILGTFPSPRSRQLNFYYGHPQNRFWRILTDLFSEPPVITIEEKSSFLRKHHIALWDVLESCEISGADDSSIRKEVPNDLSGILTGSRIRTVFTNGQKASYYYKKYFSKMIPAEWIALPSTSPANCRNWTYETLKEAYRVIPEHLSSVEHNCSHQIIITDNTCDFHRYDRP